MEASDLFHTLALSLTEESSDMFAFLDSEGRSLRRNSCIPVDSERTMGSDTHGFCVIA
ncbi:hypothetical protein BYT27DRAFT_7187204 [Phlegmacium glaucopus]|nr:hypothetical protein BYT27DRAFT_7187204 [Phlegmacium glaucopus]